MTIRALLLLGLCWPSALWAQDRAPDTAPREDQIVVIGTPLPPPPGSAAYASIVLTRDRLTGSASGSIESALATVAGFQQFRRSDSRSANPSAQGASLRALGGNAASRTLVLLDGVPVADPFFGSVPFNALVPERLGAVRVTRGGGNGAFGAGAVAGTIELTSAARDQLADVSASALLGSRAAHQLSASLAQDLPAGFAVLSGRWNRGAGFATTPPAQRSAATIPAAYDDWSIDLRGVVPVAADAGLQLRGLLFEDHRSLRFRGADSRSGGRDASIRFVSRGRWPVDALVYAQSRDFANVVVSAATFRTSLDQRRTPSGGLGGKIELRPPVSAAHVLRIGADARLAAGRMEEDAYNAGIAANPLTARRRAGGRGHGAAFMQACSSRLCSPVRAGIQGRV